ncbi:MAG: hypothetical protein Q6364_10060 [Candidatus Hermodarchaeota archaeon]|nr:hypothetical protein [Candidatus Hermodarchaeota archaeon]
MSTKTARTLTLVAGILFIVEFVSKIVVAVWAWYFLPTFLASLAPLIDPATLAMLTTIFDWLILFIPIIALISSIPTLIVAIYTLRWRHTPDLHKTGLIVIGILGLIFLGSLPGLLALIAGLIVEEPTKGDL